MSSESICPACGDKIHLKYSSKFSISQEDRENEVWLHCLNCKSYFRINRFSEEEEKNYHFLKTDWGKFGGESYGNKRKRLLQSVLGLILKYAPSPLSVLDVGCNYGGFLLKAREKGYLVEGYDLLPDAVEYCKSINLKVSCHGSSKDLKVEMNSVDIITCLDVNYYWKNQRSEVNQLTKILKNNGIFLMKVVDKSWMIKIGLALRGIMPNYANKILNRSVGNHHFSMPLKSLIKLLKQHELNILHISAFQAIQSYDSPFIVKTAFFIGEIFWKVFNIAIAPGWIVLAKKK